MLVTTLSTAAAASLSQVLPGLVAGLGIGVLTGAEVVSLGSAAVGAVVQIAQHARGRKASDDGQHAAFPGAMFHQIESELGWPLRAAS